MKKSEKNEDGNEVEEWGWTKKRISTKEFN